MNLAVIPARKGSKGLRHKNTFPILGKSLISYTVDSTIETELFDKVVVTTDSELIYHKYNNRQDVSVLYRPKKLCEDDVPLAPVVIHTLEEVEKDGNIYDIIVTLQPTSPLRSTLHIEQAMKRFKDTRADSLLSVVEELHSIWSQGDGYAEPLAYSKTTNRQYIKPHYISNGAIFITKRYILLDNKDRIGGKITLYPMDKKSSLDIHNIDDIKLAEWYLKNEK